MRYSPQTVTYQLVTRDDGSKHQQVEVPTGGGSPSVDDWDAAMVAFVDTVNTRRPGYVWHLTRTVNATGDPDATVWTAPT